MSALSNFIGSVCLNINVNTSSLEAISGSSDLWSGQALDTGDKWLNKSSDWLEGKISHINDASTLKDFFDHDFSDPNHTLSEWSQKAITELESKIAQHGDFTKEGSTYNGMASQQSSLIQATSGQQTATGDSEAKTCLSALQNSNAAVQPITSAGESVMRVLSNGNSLQGQISA